MAARAPRVMTPPSPGHSKAAEAARLFKAAKQLLLDSHIEDYVALVEENDLLRSEKTLVEGDVDSRDRKIAKQQRDIDVAKEHLDAAKAQLQEQRDRADGLSRQLHEAQEGLKASQKEMATKEAALGKEMATLKRNLNAEREELHDLKGFSVELIPVATSQKEISSKLNKIFFSARSLAEAHFGDIPPQIRSNVALWDNLKNHPDVRKDIPIPLSDTTAAKQMRIAAFLAVLAQEIWQHIFQPTYLLRDHVGLGRIIEKLAENDPDREAHLRSVLVRLADWDSKEADAVIASHITTVMINVRDYVLDLIPEKSRSSFEANLRSLCTEACEQWRFIQKLDGKIEADFSAEEAIPLYSPSTTNPPASSDAGQQSNPKSRPNGNNQNNNSKKPPTTTTTDATNLLTDAVVVWPGFYNRSTDEEETLVPGFLLTAGQVAVAKAEEKALLQQQGQKGQGSATTGQQRRAQRQQTRTSRGMSMSGGLAGAGVVLLEGGGVLGAQVAAGGGGGAAAAQSAVSGSGSGSGTGSFLSQASGGGRKGV